MENHHSWKVLIAKSTINAYLFNSYCLVVDLPLWKIWVRQLGWWHSQLNGKSKKIPCFQTTNQFFSDPLRNGPSKAALLTAVVAVVKKMVDLIHNFRFLLRETHALLLHRNFFGSWTWNLQKDRCWPPTYTKLKPVASWKYHGWKWTTLASKFRSS